MGHDEAAEGATTLGVGLALGYAFAIEVGHLLYEVEILQEDGPVGPNR
jgi:hypothetical protein